MPRVALEFLVSTASSTGALVEPSSTDTPGRRQYLLSDDYIRDFFSFLSGRLPPEDSPFWQTGRLPRASHQSDGTHSDAAFNEQEPSSVGDSEGSGSATCVESLRGTEGDASDAAGESSVKEDVMTLMWDWVTTEDSDAIGSPWEREVGRATGFRYAEGYHKAQASNSTTWRRRRRFFRTSRPSAGEWMVDLLASRMRRDWVIIDHRHDT
jgi:hypothetical protein